jgi:hypothetical protein
MRTRALLASTSSSAALFLFSSAGAVDGLSFSFRLSKDDLLTAACSVGHAQNVVEAWQKAWTGFAMREEGVVVPRREVPCRFCSQIMAHGCSFVFPL